MGRFFKIFLALLNGVFLLFLALPIEQSWSTDAIITPKNSRDRIRPVQSNIPEEGFQTRLIMEALRRLGYDVAEPVIVPYATAHLLIARGGSDFMANHWKPLHNDYFRYAGGDGKLFRSRLYIYPAFQGYRIDRKTAETYKITHLQQLQNKEIAALFDHDGDGRADLIGCDPGWACGDVIRHHLSRYKLDYNVRQLRGGYQNRIRTVIDRLKQGKPSLFYSWSPHWMAGIIDAGQDAVWLEVPFSTFPGYQDGELNTKLPDGRDLGFGVNSQHIVANKRWVSQNPEIEALFNVMRLPAEDISAQNVRLYHSKNKRHQVQKDTAEWIENNADLFQSWIDLARSTLRQQPVKIIETSP